MAWVAGGVLFVFVALYVALTAWFVLTAWRSFSSLGSAAEGGIAFIAGLFAAFLAVFMLKALFVARHREKTKDLEVTADEQPRLFDFLYRLADEAGAPRPKRVFLSASVNAAVFYDLSILNLIFPSKKNLDIGLGLVNVLTLSEFKAVCAHEFGHFAQRTMAVGRWVYTAQQIAAQIIAKRDILDRALDWLSGIDLRIAWIGWVLRLIVWSIRSLTESAFRLVVLAHRALSREMEMQADLVAVSLTGSDSLIYALHKLQGADDAWDRTMMFCMAQSADGHLVQDAFTLQTRILDRVGSLLGDPSYGKRPPAPLDSPEKHRVFRAEMAQPPRMWSTHPPNDEREENAKRTYLTAPADDRSAWEIFIDPAQLRQTVTMRVLAEAAPAGTERKLQETEESLQVLDNQFAREDLSPVYKGIYLARSPVIRVASAEQLYEAPPIAVSLSDLDSLYPTTLSQEVESLRNLKNEESLLRALKSGDLSASGGVIRHRSRAIQAEQLPVAIEEVGAEITAVHHRLSAHDRRCRTVHRAVAARLNQGWADYLSSLARLLHYAEHSLANVEDAFGTLLHYCSFESASGRIGSGGVQRIVAEAKDLHRCLAGVYDRAEFVTFDPPIGAKLKADGWTEALGQFELAVPDASNLGDWLNASGSWVQHVNGCLTVLRNVTIERLLAVEAEMAAHFRAGTEPGVAPEPCQSPREYPVLIPGSERKRPEQLSWWAKFQTATGVGPAVARTAAALAITGTVLGIGSTATQSRVHVYNGLDRTVAVSVGDHRALLEPRQNKSFSVAPLASLQITATTGSGELIEQFTERLESGESQYVYSVAGAAPLVEWTAVYGKRDPIPPRVIGARRWVSTSVNHVLDKPPETVSTRYGRGSTRTVLSAIGEDPNIMLNALASDEQRRGVIASHVRWDNGKSPAILTWIRAAAGNESFRNLLTERLRLNPREVISLRALQDATSGEEHRQLCEKHIEMARANPDDGDLQYLSVRCTADGAAQDQAFLTQWRRLPHNPWLGWAAGWVMANEERWTEAERAMVPAFREPALMEWAAVETARLRRLASTSQFFQIEDLTGYSQILAHVQKMYKDGGDTSDQVFAHLARGQLDAALEKVKGSEAEPRIVRMVAASNGANSAIINRALALGASEGLDTVTVWAALGLAIRHGAPEEPFWPLVQEASGSKLAEVRQFVTLVKAKEFDKASQVARKVHFDLRAHLYMTATVALEQETPEAWRAYAIKALFPHERPYL